MLGKIMKDGKTLILAYDQGLEHGPSDFDEKNVNPEYILKIAKEGKFNAVAFHKGIAEKYRELIKTPLVLKLNGKTNISKEDPISPTVCSVEEAVKLKADAIGFTLYIGSEYEYKIFEEFAKVQKEARRKHLPIITWIYPRGKAVGKNEGKYMAYAARVGLELGADIIKIKYNGNARDLAWAVENAGKAKVVIAGGVKSKESKLLNQVREIMDAGAAGMAIGRNIWQAKDPIGITERIQKIIWRR
ncbi:MAG: fructose-bisphosphate aldolase [Nanoarchaeota archaeon]|nr:fructose-bisphosphate aldolase [Nanoarchaeota archaeon]|tara:strand:+ start:105 stop:839 length:735 start_codon:yes stop_codon:yes gene_type:complete